MGKYYQRRTARELKPLGINLIARKKIAKAIDRADGSIHTVLLDLGFKVVKSIPCCEDNCDLWAHVTWERDGKILKTNFGTVDVGAIMQQAAQMPIA